MTSGQALSLHSNRKSRKDRHSDRGSKTIETVLGKYVFLEKDNSLGGGLIVYNKEAWIEINESDL